MWVVTRENHLGLSPVQIQVRQARRHQVPPRHPVHQARRPHRQVHILRFHH